MTNRNDTVPPVVGRKRGVWLNVYPHCVEAFNNKGAADRYAEGLLDCVYVEFEYEEPSE